MFPPQLPQIELQRMQAMLPTCMASSRSAAAMLPPALLPLPP
jgi:hypothetical protein